METATLSYLSLSGAKYGQESNVTALERANAAKTAGFTSIGVSLADSLSEAPNVHDAGVTTPELEWVELGRPITALDLTTLALSLSVWGVTRINAGITWRTPEPLRMIGERLRAVANVAAEHNATIAVEPVAFGWLRRVEGVQCVLAEADMPNTGLLLDMWQVYQDGPEWFGPGLARDAVEIQICGVPLIRPHGARTRFSRSQDRPTLTESGVNVTAWLTALRDAGCRAPLSVELPNSRLNTLSVTDRAAAIKAML